MRIGMIPVTRTARLEEFRRTLREHQGDRSDARLGERILMHHFRHLPLDAQLTVIAYHLQVPPADMILASSEVHGSSRREGQPTESPASTGGGSGRRPRYLPRKSGLDKPDDARQPVPLGPAQQR